MAPDAPKIQTAPVQMMDQQVFPLAYVGKEFPDGLDLLLMPPGGLAAIGSQRIPQGYMVAILPPGPGTNHLVALAREMASKVKHVDGAVRAPGLH
jgi:hypothetical protein